MHYASDHSQSKYGLETLRKSLFYPFVRFYADLCKPILDLAQQEHLGGHKTSLKFNLP